MWYSKKQTTQYSVFPVVFKLFNLTISVSEWGRNMIHNNKQREIDYRMCNILINPYLHSLGGNIGVPSEKGRQLQWIILLTIMFVIAVIIIVVEI